MDHTCLEESLRWGGWDKRKKGQELLNLSQVSLKISMNQVITIITSADICPVPCGLGLLEREGTCITRQFGTQSFNPWINKHHICMFLALSTPSSLRSCPRDWIFIFWGGNRALFYCRVIAKGCFSGTDKANQPLLIKHGTTARGKGAELSPSQCLWCDLWRLQVVSYYEKKKEKGFFSLLLCVKPTATAKKSDKFALLPVAESKQKQLENKNKGTKQSMQEADGWFKRNENTASTLWKVSSSHYLSSCYSGHHSFEIKLPEPLTLDTQNQSLSLSTPDLYVWISLVLLKFLTF